MKYIYPHVITKVTKYLRFLQEIESFPDLPPPKLQLSRSLGLLSQPPREIRIMAPNKPSTELALQPSEILCFRPSKSPPTAHIRWVIHRAVDHSWTESTFH